ncbi:MAG: hypothetical protein H0U75_11140 [Legionella sp.]|nr:hypothetical protein [Legionella sp.]
MDNNSEKDMKFLIPTEPDDSHAILVKLALEDCGQEVRLLFLADQPTKLKHTVFIDQGGYKWKSKDEYHCAVDNDYDVVWWRRARRPHIPKNCTHPDDFKFVERENIYFYESITNNLAPNARWINNKDAAIRANSKMLQLRIAVTCGMTIPTTLCSNDPQEILEFLKENAKEGAVYKPLCTNCWFEDEGIRIPYTSKISIPALSSNRLLQLTPSIFQKEIKKKYELRVTYFDGFIVAAKINSQIHTAGKVDWRAIPHDQLHIEPYTLPILLADQIRAFMEQMNLVFGALDFIVNEDHTYVFLEVNEQGQFLWIEALNSDFKMLDIFIQLLLNKKSSFDWKQDKQSEFRFEAYNNTANKIVSQNMQCHVALNTAKGYNS